MEESIGLKRIKEMISAEKAGHIENDRVASQESIHSHLKLDTVHLWSLQYTYTFNGP